MMTSLADESREAAEQAPDLPPPDRIALFLDFDGTLVDLAETPQGVRVPADLELLLSDLTRATEGALAIVSGRSVDQILGFLPGYSGVIAGGHGAETFRNGEKRLHPLAGSPEVADAIRRAHAFAGSDNRLLVEEKPSGVVLHYRQAPDRAQAVLTEMQAIVEGSEALVVSRAKMAVEIRPVDASKDRAVARLAAEPPFAKREGWFFGDDDTDEDAMRWMLGQGGRAVKVGEGDTVAPHRVPGPGAVTALLRRWVDDREVR